MGVSFAFDINFDINAEKGSCHRGQSACM